MSIRSTHKESERKKKIAESDLLDRTEPLDEEDQEKVLQSLRTTAQRQSRNGRKYFGILFKIISIVLLCTLLYSIQNPYEIAHQRILAEWIPLNAFNSYYFALALCYALSGFAISQGILKTSILIRIIVVTLASIFTLVWVYYFLRYDITEWSLFWMPLAPSACVGFAIYVDWDADNNILQVENLAGLKYSFKRV